MGCESKTTQDSFICLVRKRGKKKAESRLPLSPNSPYVLILRPSGQTQACLAWDCLGPVLSYCAQMLKDQKGIKEKKSQTAWRNEEIASYYHGVFKRTVKKICPVYFPLSWNGKIFGSAFFYWNGAPWERKRKWSGVCGSAKIGSCEQTGVWGNVCCVCAGVQNTLRGVWE